MFIKELNIIAFGPLENRVIELSRGLNIIEGANESGKSTVCMFIKFMLYGLSSRTQEGEISERAKYVSWNAGKAEGSMVISTAGGEYKIERELSASTDANGQLQYRENLFVTNTVSGERAFKGEVPGEAILGFDENMFLNTVFVRQLSGSRIDGSGMTEAIENLLLTGDESLSVKKAVDRLEKARKSLMHKRGSGGKLQLAMQEEARLCTRLEEAKQGNAGIVNLENEKSKLSALIEKRTAEKEENELLCIACEKLERAKRLESARELMARVDELSREYAALEKYGNISEGVGKIKSRGVRLENIDSRLKTQRRSLPKVPSEADRMSEEEIAAALEEKESAEKNKRKAGRFATLFYVFYVAAILCDLLCFVLPGSSGFDIKSGGVLTLSLIIALAAFLCAAIVFTVFRIVIGSRVKAVFRKWDCKNLSALEKKIDNAVMKGRIHARTTAEIERLEGEIAESELERDSAVFALREAARVFVEEDIPDTDILVSAALEKAKEVSLARDDVLSRLSMAKGELAGYRDVLSDDNGARVEREALEVLATPAGERAKGFAKKDIDLCKNKLNFVENALPHLLEQKKEVELSLTHLKATTQNSSAIAALLDSTRREIERMKKSLSGIEGAREALLLAGERLRSSLMPRVSAEAADMLCDFTEGKYEDIAIDRDFNVEMIPDGKRRALSYMSCGTGDIVYIALRSALVKVLFHSDVPFLVYDESFARIDEKRLSHIIDLLCASGERGNQSLVFTCRELEGALSAKNEGTKIIEL